jgi:hypothetical protein
MSTSGELEYGEHLPSGLAGRLVSGLVVVVFLGSLFGTGMADVLFPVQGIQLIGEEAQRQERTASRARLRDGSLARWYEDKLRQHSRVRDCLLPRYAYYKFLYFDQVPEGFTVGKKHWMFHSKRIHLSPQSDAVLARSGANSIVALDRRLLGHGITLTVLPIPRKCWVAHEFLPKGTNGRRAVDDLLIDQLKQRAVSTVDMRAAYAAGDPEQYYFKLDTHWTPSAARMAAQEFARTAGLLKDPAQRAGKLRHLPSEHRLGNGFAMLLSLGVDLETIDLETLDLLMPTAKRLSFQPALESWLQQPKELSTFALAGSSFSRNERLGRFLVHYLGAKVLDGAEPAQPYMTSVANTLAKYYEDQDQGQLQRLFWEVPVSSIFHGYAPEGVSFNEAFGRCFQIVEPAAHQSWQPWPGGWTDFDSRSTETSDKVRQPLLTMPAGVLAHSGDGVALLHLSGEVLGGPLMLRMVHDGLSIELEINPGQFDFAWPIIALGPSANALRVFVGSSQEDRLKLSAASLWHQPVGPEVFKLSAREVEGRTELVPIAPIPLRRRAALQILCEAERNPMQEVVVEIWSEGQELPRRVSFGYIAPGGAIFLDLGEEAALRLSKVVLRAKGAVPKVKHATVSSGR